MYLKMDELAGAKRKKPLDDVRRFHIWGQPFWAAAAFRTASPANRDTKPESMRESTQKRRPEGSNARCQKPRN